MSIKIQIAFWLYLAIVVPLAGWGVRFLLRDEFLPYHSVAVGMPWAEVPSNFQLLIMALIKLVGGLWVAFAFAMVAILLVPFRQGAPWALWAVPVLLLVQLGGTANAMRQVILKTSAKPPLNIVIGSSVMVLIALALTIADVK